MSVSLNPSEVTAPLPQGEGQGVGLLLVLLGPTAVGKTELSLRLAKLLSCPIISADSRQMFRGIRIGTAAPTDEELQQVPHYFVHTLDLDQYYSAAQYEADVLEMLDHPQPLLEEGRKPLGQNTPPQGGDGGGRLVSFILSGGSMMYIDAVCNGIDDIPTIRDDVRASVRQRLESEGLDVLCQELRLLDPEYYAIADLKNTQRIVHALEVCYQTGRTFTSFRTGQKKERPFRIVKVGLCRSRENLFRRINQRVDQMMADGFLDEARSVYPLRHLNSLNTVGYKELFRVIDGTWPLDMAIERIKKNTRVYAKKQMTWFQRDPSIHWLNLDTLTTDQALQHILDIVENG